MIHTIKDLLDMLNTDGGHIVLSLFLMAVGLFCMSRGVIEGKELFLFSVAFLGRAMNSTGRANGKPEPSKEKTA